jgi:hypothetical protein
MPTIISGDGTITGLTATGISAAQTVSASNITTGTLPFAQLPAGSVLQVVQVTSGTEVSASSSTIADVMSASITPKFSTSKILVQATINGLSQNGATSSYGYGSTVGLLLTDSSNTVLSRIFDSAAGRNFNSTGLLYVATGAMNYLHSPATTSSFTYKIRIYNGNGVNSGIVYANNSGASYTNSSITLLEIAA